jgi:multidrug efflux system membrane fusion protein
MRQLPSFRSLVLAAASVAMILSIGCRKAVRSVDTAVPVTAVKVEQRTVAITQTTVGLVQPLHTVALQSQVDGIIEKVHFREGDEVAAGTLLVTLDQRPFQAALKSAQAGLTEARANGEKASADLARYEQLRKQSVVSESELAQYSAADSTGRATIAVREAALATATLNLSYTEIRAPIAGRTSRLSVREGSLVKTNDATRPLLTINQMAPTGVDFSLPESQLAAVRAALAAGSVPVTATLQNGSKATATGALDYIDNTVGTTSGTVALRAVFPNTDATLWPGQFVSATIKLGEQSDALLVPVGAVLNGQQGSQLFVIKADNTVEVRSVHQGILEGNNVVVTGDIKAGETVVLDGQLRLVPGSKVTVKQPGEKPAANATKSSGNPKSKKS